MAASAENVVCIFSEFPLKIKKFKCRKGQHISKGTLVCICTNDKNDVQRLKSPYGGVVKDILGKEGDEIGTGSPLYKVEVCSHPTVMKDMCADCGSDLRLENAAAGDRKEQASASVAMVHSIPELIVSEQLAKELGKADEESLLKTRKLVLLVDLDQTLIHTTNDNIPANLKDVHHFQLWHGNQLLWYHTRLRPFTQTFLDSISKLYELHICTFGARMYAHTIAKILDPEGKYFSHRILSRDECFNASTKTANLKALFPCGDSMVSIIDDREDVWSFSPNLIHVKPYRFFQGTADINAPAGLTKTEQDEKPMVHRVRRVSQSSTNSTDSNENDKNEKSKFPTEEEMKRAEKAKVEQKVIMEIDEESIEKEDEEITDNIKDKEKTDGSETKDDSAKAIDTNNAKEKTKETDNKNESQVEDETVKEGKNNKLSEKDIENKDSVDEKKETDEKEGKCEDNEKSAEKSEKDDKSKDKKEEEELIVWEDEDDYLFYLKEILENIHQAFYDMVDQLKKKDQPPQEKDKPNLKNIIPYMKKKVLKGCNIVFSGVIPTNMVQEKSRAYIVATALGATVQKDLVTKDKTKDSSKITTHLVAARLGTSKVRTALKCKRICITDINWLWSCSERWERVEENLFPLTKTSEDRTCDSPDVAEMMKKKDGKRKLESDDSPERTEKRSKTEGKNYNKNSSKQGKKDSSGKAEGDFSHSYNPMLAFDDDDLAYMDKEVDDAMDSEGDESSEDEVDPEKRLRDEVLNDLRTDTSSEDSLSGGNMPRGWGLKNKLKMSPKSSSSEDEAKSPIPQADNLGPEYESETDQDKFEKIMDAFGPVTDNSEEEYQESIGSVDDELADAVEKEFLS